MHVSGESVKFRHLTAIFALGRYFVHHLVIATRVQIIACPSAGRHKVGVLESALGQLQSHGGARCPSAYSVLQLGSLERPSGYLHCSAAQRVSSMPAREGTSGNRTLIRRSPRHLKKTECPVGIRNTSIGTERVQETGWEIILLRLDRFERKQTS